MKVTTPKHRVLYRLVRLFRDDPCGPRMAGIAARQVADAYERADGSQRLLLLADLELDEARKGQEGGR